MTKSPKEKGMEKQRLSDWINDYLRKLVYEGTIRGWQDIDWNKILRREDLRKVKKALEGEDG